MRKLSLLVLAIALAFSSGCMSTKSLGAEDPFGVTKPKAKQIKIGVTTRDQLQELFGPPNMKVTNPEGVYYFYKDINLGALWVEFGDDWFVRDFEWTD